MRNLLSSMNSGLSKLLQIQIIEKKTLGQFYKYKSERDLFVQVKDVFKKIFTRKIYFLIF